MAANTLSLLLPLHLWNTRKETKGDGKRGGGKKGVRRRGEKIAEEMEGVWKGGEEKEAEWII